jgi:DNA-binding response OmpR family regulator
MISVLIVDDDIQLGRALMRALNAHGFASVTAGGYDEALVALGQQPYDVLITDLRMGEKGGIELLRALRETASNTRPILMSAYATARDSQLALDLGAIRVLCKPFETRDVIEAIERAVDSSTGYVGMVHGLSLIDMLQMFHFGRRSLTLELIAKTCSTVSMKDGEIVDARHGTEAGETALRAILRMAAGSLKTRSLRHFTPSIDREFQTLLLDLVRELDEASRSLPPMSSTPHASGVRKIGWDGRHSSKPPRAELDAACRGVAGKVDGALGCDVLDLQSGRLLGSYRSSEFADGRAQVAAATVIQLFLGASTARSGPRHADSTPVEAEFDEFYLTSAERIHFAKALASRRSIVVLSARRSATVALGWAQLRAAMGTIEAAFAQSTPKAEASEPNLLVSGAGGASPRSDRRSAHAAAESGKVP